ncbi:cell wall protein [Streptomyces phaeofaciens JCM 4814]|uniref:Cell wall protein n=1 Tax=Streptomyces phaeofaciens TaxID=68254 RepID=A0A918M0J7_9ACTN|nr:hypothetical protein [Streptomyces phaeofaciens]GGT94453.1 hypothetical protein GCM10010226_85290 [Streptomyces phaeofaciens]
MRRAPHHQHAEPHRLEPVRPAEQDVITTHSRRSWPRPWLKAVAWLIDIGAHPKALATTTVDVALDLAARMDFQRGIVLYDLEGTTRRTGLSRATVKRHIKILRELGALVWLQHGSRRNLRLAGRPYTATATVYGATIPPAYDDAHGHRLSGHGYTARRTGFTEAGRAQAIVIAQETTARLQREPPSRSNTTHSPNPDLRGTSTTTPQARATKIAKPRKKSVLGRPVTAAVYKAADRFARVLRPLHNWLQRTRIEQLSWVLVDKAADGATLQQIHAWLHEINPAHYFGPRWRPARAHAYVAAKLQQDAARERETAQRLADEARATPPTAEFTNAAQVLRNESVGGGEEFAEITAIDELDASLVQQMRADAWGRFKHYGDTDLVLTVADGLGKAAASRLYTAQLVDACIRFRANPRLQPAH